MDGDTASVSSDTGVVVREPPTNSTQVIRLNRPGVLNAFNDRMLLELGRAIREADSDPEIRSVVITGTGKAFCAGADIKSPWDPETAVLGLRRRLNPVILALADLHKPLIAAVNGTVAGAGIGLMCTADVRLTSRSARFVPATGKLGLVPDGGTTYFVPRLIGPGNAFRWLCGGAPIDAETAAAWGLVDEVCDRPVLAEALEIAGSFGAAQGSSLALTKQLLRCSRGSSLAEQLELEQQFQDRAQASGLAWPADR